MTDWQPMHSAPMDGRYIYGLYKDGSVDVVRWEEQRRCMLAGLAPGSGDCGEGWESKIAGNLPVDPPLAWRPMEDKR